MTNYFPMIFKILISILFISLKFLQTNSDVLVTGSCGRPNRPPRAQFLHKSRDQNRFDNNEKVDIICRENQFPHYKQERVCKNGRWTGKTARCGRSLGSQVIKFEVENCETSNKLLSQSFNQTLESKQRLLTNSFHSSRINNQTKNSVKGSACYLWKIKFDKSVQITYLSIQFISPMKNITKQLPNLMPFINKFRKCELQKTNREFSKTSELFNYYYFCDLKLEDRNQELNELSDTISVRINTSVEREIGLESVIIGDVYLDNNDGNSIVQQKCGELEIQNIGVDIDKVSRKYNNIWCNDSFVDSVNPDKRYEFTCDVNGQWVGEYPVCVPILTCPKEEIIDDKHSSVIIEEIGNVYYLNTSDWYAINDTWVRYKCKTDNEIMVGSNFRTCRKSGQWSTNSPYCSGGVSGFLIAGIVFAVLIIFVMIVFLIFRFHSIRVNRKLMQTRDEIEENARKRISVEYYADVRDDMGYEDISALNRTTMMYDKIDYDTTYEMLSNENNQKPKTEYLFMLPENE